MKLTKEQVEAIKTIDSNVIVNAGAGTGKTEVLTRRYIELLEKGKFNEGEDVSNIVAITFTIKAANEMKERIRKLIKDEYKDRDYDLNEAKISTIHSFCINLIRENSFYLDINPSFEILEEKDSDKLLEDIVVDIFKEDEFGELLQLLMEKTGKNEFSDLILEIKFIYKNFKNILYSIEEIETNTLEDLSKNNQYSKIEEIVDEVDYIKENIKLAKNTKLYKMMEKHELTKEILEENRKLFIELYDNVNSLKKEELDYIKKILDLELEYREYTNLEIYESLFKVLKVLDRLFYSKKTEMGKFDFNDLEHLTLKLLKDDKIRTKIQSEINYLMVDEYQDSNDIQKEIFYSICSKESILDRDNIFVVGDPKQSIYGFRGANINVFADTLRDIKDTDGKIIIFTDNFRTDKRILKGINSIYENLMGDRYDKLNANKDLGIDNIFSYLNNDNKKDQFYEPENISNYISSSINDNNKIGDNILLFRTRNGQRNFENSLSERNIPYYTFNSLGFYESKEIKVIIEILKLIKNTDNPLSLYYILKSNLYNIDDSEIMSYLKKEDNMDIENYIFEIMNKIDILKHADNSSISNYIEEIYTVFKFYEHYNYLEKNIQKQGNLYKLKDIAKNYDEENLSFDDFFYDLINNNNDETMKQVEDENSDVVKLMTIHGSKGLGFKNVIVPYINKPSKNSLGLFKFDKSLGLAIDLKGANPRYRNISFIEKEVAKIEDDNLYYVAMTRAKEKLILGMSGYKSGYKKTLLDEVEKIENENIIKRIENEDFNKYTEKEKIMDLNMEFPNLKPFESSYRNSLNLNISEVLENYIEKLNIMKVNVEEENEKSKITDLPFDLIGNIIHRFAEKYDGSTDLKVEEILEEFNIDKKYNNFFNKYINNFKNLYSGNFNISYNEIPFYYKYNNYFFRGIIDRIELYEDKVRIIDYKFSKLNKVDLEKTYWIQLIFYGMVCEEAYKDKNIELVIKNIRNNYEIKIDYDIKRKKELKEILNRYILDNTD